MFSNIKIYLLCCTVTLSFCAGCKKDNVEIKEPVVEVTPNPTDSGKITFQNESQNAVSYSWDFGDGETSSEKSPSHQYLFNGTYTVKTCATGAKNVEICKETTVKVTDAPMIKIAEETINLINYQSLYTVKDNNLILKVIRKGKAGENINTIIFRPAVCIDANQNNKVDAGVDFTIIPANYDGILRAYLSFYLSGNTFSWDIDYNTGATITADNESSTFTIPLSLITEKTSPDKSKAYISFQIVTSGGAIERLILPSGGAGETWNFRTFEKKYIIKLP